jgi:hypothetical protein
LAELDAAARRVWQQQQQQAGRAGGC